MDNLFIRDCYSLKSLKSLKVATTLSGLITLFSLSVQAETPEGLYVGGKVGLVHYNASCDDQAIDCDNDSLGGGVFLGYKLNDWLSVEGGYDHFGNVKAIYPALNNSAVKSKYEGEAQGIELGLKADYRLSENVSFFGKAGMLGWQVDKSGKEIGYTISEKDQGMSPMLGTGFEYSLTSKIITRVEYQWFNNVGDKDTGGSNINMLTIGLVYSFGDTGTEVDIVPDIIEDPEEMVVTVDSLTEDGLLFEFDQYELNRRIFYKLNPILTRLKVYPNTSLRIVGHTDSTGSTEYNLDLSKKRAESVANFFKEKGINSERIYVEGKGELEPIFSNETSDGRSKNRRVEITSPAVSVRESK